MTVRSSGTDKILGTQWIHSDHSYKSSGALEAHFGLDEVNKVDLEIVLPNRQRVLAKSVNANQFLDMNMKTQKSNVVVVR
ncbi:MAG: ASPIC/UnbV domain-containing protein [Fimbriimonas sp.]|nr:ASPIC/UnbV domain-containing protein [Fimbriimonas sp.]